MEFYLLNHEATYEDIKVFRYPNQRVGVIAHIENDKGDILLQQRGNNSRDEQNLYEDIGGSVEAEDISFESALLREIYEEAGDELDLAIHPSMGIFHCYKNDIHWIFIIYFVHFIDGTFKVMEPEKCKGYKFFHYEEIMSSSKVSKSCKFLTKSVRNHFAYISPKERNIEKGKTR